jgi:hypothetical protein
MSDGIVELWCLDCDYIQDHIPDIVTEMHGATGPLTRDDGEA